MWDPPGRVTGNKTSRVGSDKPAVSWSAMDLSVEVLDQRAGRLQELDRTSDPPRHPIGPHRASRVSSPMRADSSPVRVLIVHVSGVRPRGRPERRRLTKDRAWLRSD